jgi:hypothetical protein
MTRQRRDPAPKRAGWPCRKYLEWKLGVAKHMLTLSLPAIFWLTIVIQLMGVASIVALRLCGSDRSRLACQRLFVTMLLALAAVTLLAFGADSDCWATSGATLSVMTVCATFDSRSDRRHSHAF